MINIKKSAQNEKKIRESGVELLRIVATFFVITLHYNEIEAFNSVIPNSMNYYILMFLESVSICAVDVFIIITGYYSSRNNKRNLTKIIELLSQLILINVAYALFKLVLDGNLFTASGIRAILSAFIPNNYFLVLYSCLYLISPLINIVVNVLDNQKLKKVMILLVVLFPVWNTLVDILELLRGGESIIGLSSLGISGSQNGFNIVNFIICYLAGACVQRFKLDTKSEWIKVFQGYIFATVLIYIFALFENRLHIQGLLIAWKYHNPLVIFAGVSLLILFTKISLRSHVINSISAASFACYLLHGYILHHLRIQDFVNKNCVILLLHLFVCFLLSYFLSFIFDKVWKMLTFRFFTSISGKLRGVLDFME